MLNSKKIVFTTGGTGGHINPALAVAGEIRRKYPDAEILFIGTSDRLETKLALQKEYRKCYFKDISKAEMQYVFPNHEIVMLEFKDSTKAVKINMSDLDVPIDVLYKNIVERIN